MNNTSEIDQLLKEGQEKARKMAASVLGRIKKAIGILA